MIKDREIAMVNAASAALEFRAKYPRIWDEDIIKKVFSTINAKSELKIYGVAAANEVLKLRKSYQDLTDKQILQMFVDNIFEFVSRIDD